MTRAHLISPFSKKTNVYTEEKDAYDRDASFSQSPNTTIKRLNQLPTVENFLAIMNDAPSSPESSYYSAKSTTSSSSTLDTFLLDDDSPVDEKPPAIPPRRSSMPFLQKPVQQEAPPPLPLNAKKTITDAYTRKLSKPKSDDSWSSIFNLNEKVKLAKSIGAKKPEILKVTENGQTVLLYEMIGGKFQVIAGTPERLFEKLADETVQDTHYVDTFIIHHSSFTMSSVLLEQLISRFYLSPSPGEHEYFKKWQFSIQTKVLNVIDRWITIQFQDFKSDVHLLKQLKKFLFHNDIVLLKQFTQQVEKIQQNLKSQILHFSAHPVTSIVQTSPPSPTFNFHFPFVHPQVIPPVHISSSLRRHGLFNMSPVESSPMTSYFPAYTSLLSIESKLLARYLTLADYYLFKTILSRGLLNNDHYSEHTNYIDLMTKRANMLSHWVVHELCNKTYIKAKRNLVKKFIEIAKLCLELNNYHTCMVITMGLTSVPDLKEVRDSLSNRDMNTFTSLQKLLDVSMNMRYYRQKIQFYKSPCVPFLPVVLKDQTFFKENSTFLVSDPSLVNFSKFRSIRQFVDKTKDMTSESYWFATELTHYPFFPMSTTNDVNHSLDPIADWVESRLHKVHDCYLQCDLFK